MASTNLIQYHTEQTENVRANSLGSPILTVDASNRYALTCANLVEYYGNGVPLDLREPMRTVTAHDREALMAAHIVEFKGQDIGQRADAPLEYFSKYDLADVQKILGDNYDLARLRQLVDADRDGRCVVYQAGHNVVSYYHKEGHLFIRECSGVVREDEYEAALKGEQNDVQGI